jgi:acetyl esterase/lipase
VAREVGDPGAPAQVVEADRPARRGLEREVGEAHGGSVPSAAVDRALLRAYAAGLAVRGIVSLPDPVLRAAAGPVPEVARGLQPDAWLLARMATLADRLAARRDPPPLEDQRRHAEAQTRFLALAPRRPVRTEDADAGGVAVRRYEPVDPRDGLLVFFHGGGWVQRSVAGHDRAVRFLSDLSGVRVVSVEYRRAPEHPFPAAADDALAAYLAIAEAEAGPLAVGGDSAGGNLAASVAITARDRGLRVPDFQWLLYPATDAPRRHPSEHAFRTGFGLTQAAMDRYRDLYLPDPASRADPRASPLYADPSGLPPAYVATALADPLRDEGEAYAEHLRTAGVPAVTQRFGLLHGFFNATASRTARDAVAVTAGALRAGLR